MNYFFMRNFLGLALIAITFSLHAQTTDASSVKNAITYLADNFPQEKIYIHFDKPSYAAGETIWYKAYIITGADLFNISKTLYVDFIGEGGNILKHCIQPVYQASSSGEFEIPLEYKNQSVYVKAYTRWMLNFDSSFLYNKALHLIQTKSSLKTQPVQAVKTFVQFFPEGGDLVKGIESKIAFKAIKFNGEPATVKGIVINSKNQKVAEITCLHDGMGFFNLTPENGETYSAKWKDDEENNYQTFLPEAKDTGVTLQLKTQNSSRGFIINRSENAGNNLKKLYIVATMFQHAVYMATINLEESFVTGGSMPVHDLPTGILQVTLFDSNWIALEERITFINNNNYYFEPEVGFSQLGTGKRKENTLVINVPDSIISNLSVSVTDAGMGIDSSNDIISGLLLTGDLKGNIHHPAYYFKNNSDSLQQQLDLVMLTNGWRRINWQDLINGKTPSIKYPNDTAYLSLAGKIYGATPQDLRKGAVLLMILDNKKDTARRIEQTAIEASGNFAEPNIILFDTTTVYYKVSGNESFANSSEVSFNNGMLAAAKINSTDTFSNRIYFDTANENYKRKLAEAQLRLLKMQQGTTLADVTVKTRAKSAAQVLDEKYTSPLFSSGDAYNFDVINDPFGKTAISILSYLQGKVAGLTISTGSGINSSGSVTWRGSTPAFYLNESPVDISLLSNTSMQDVAYIKVFRPPFLGSIGGGSGGAIAVYTRKGGDITQTKGKGMPYKIIIGYTALKEFYSPDYGTYNINNEQQDLRTTLYWNPMVLTSHENHSIRLHFYNNDFSESFRVIVEGVSTNGKLAHVEKVIE